MALLKFLIIIVFNLSLGLTPVLLIIGFLFYPKEKKYIGYKQIPLTPAFAYRKKEQLMRKIHRLLHDYLEECESLDQNSRVAKWEQKAFKSAFEKYGWIDDIRWLPGVIKEKIHHFISTVAYEVVRQFLRKFVPFLIEKYKLESYIAIIDKKLDVEVIKEFFMKYIFKYIMIVLAICYGLLGLFNGFLFLIIK